MPFRVTDEMRRMAEAERSFSPEVGRAQFREFRERMRWNLYRPLRRGFLGFAPHRLPDALAIDEFLPTSPNYLYLLAKETKNGDYRAYERFLHYLMLEVTGDTVAAVDERFRITFESKANNRWDWWNEPSLDAYQWLRTQISEEAKPEPTTEFKTALIEPKDAHAHKSKVLDPDLRDFMLREALHRALPHQQAEVLWLRAIFHDSKEPSKTTRAIAEHLGIEPVTVRWHKAEALKNPRLKKGLRRA